MNNPLYILLPSLLEVAGAIGSRHIDNSGARRLFEGILDTATNGFALQARLDALRAWMNEQRIAAAQNGEVWRPSREEIASLIENINSRDEEWDKVVSDLKIGADETAADEAVLNVFTLRDELERQGSIETFVAQDAPAAPPPAPPVPGSDEFEKG